MSIPIYVDDGSFRTPTQAGTAHYTLPFADRGDYTSFQVSIPFKIDINHFRDTSPLSAGTRRSFPKGDAYLVDIRNMRESGNNLMEWETIYASVPITRQEFTTVSYERFYENNPESTIESFIQDTQGVAIYQYKWYTPLPDLIAPKPVQLGGIWFEFGGYGGEPAEGAEVLAENSKTSIYIGRIFERRSVYVKHKSLGSEIFP
jgi:hypothetical protein